MAVVLFIRGKRFFFEVKAEPAKCTHTRLWRENIAGSKLLNDDSPIVRYEEGGRVGIWQPVEWEDSLL